MKRIVLVCLFFISFINISLSQKSFIGVAKYKMKVEGATNNNTDSMKVVFGKDKIMTIFYLPAAENSDKPKESIYIDDFASNTTTEINKETMTYSVTPLNNKEEYQFMKTNKFNAVQNNICITYLVDSTKMDREKYKKIYCLASVDYSYYEKTNYFFYGVQPIIIDNRIVFDYTIEQKDGQKPKVFLYDIQKMDDVESYFSLWGYKLK